MGNADVQECLLDRPLLNAKILKQNLPTMKKALDLLLRFKPMLIEEVTEIEGGLRRGDLEGVRFHTHRIRSGSLYLGIEGIGFPATRLEELIEGDAPMDEMVAAWRLLRKACRRFCGHDRAQLASLLGALAEN